MSILTPVDETLNKADRAIELLEEKETWIFDLLNCASANIVITNHNLPHLVKEALDNAKFPLLSSYRGREIVSLDCRDLKKGDAYGWMVTLSKKVKETPDLNRDDCFTASNSRILR